MTALIAHLFVAQWQKDHNLIDPSKKLIPLERFLQRGVKLFGELPDAFEISLVPIFRRCDESVEPWRRRPDLL